MAKVLIIGGAGNLGRRLIVEALAGGLDVTTLVRSRVVLGERWQGALPEALRVIEGDAGNPLTLNTAFGGQQAMISAAGNVFDGERFVELFDAVTAAAERSFSQNQPVWMLGGLAVLDFGATRRRGLDLPFVPKAYRNHGVNLARLERSSLAWTLICPGPMTAFGSGEVARALPLSRDVVPFEVRRWLRYAPAIFSAQRLKRHLPTVTVTYEDVARTMIAHLFDTALARHRVGLALPAGETLRKQGWQAGQQSGVE